VVSFDPKLTGARACRDQFVSLFKGEVTTDQVVAAVAEARMQLGDARDDMHAYFSNLADRVGGTALAPFDESLFGYLMDYHGPEIVGVETPAPQAFTEEAERELHERLRMAATDIATEPIERWLDEHFSQEAQRRRRRADFAELGDRYPHSPGRVEGAMQPENHDWSALHNAIQRCIDAGFPAKRSTGFRREWASTFLWLAELATNPDREWRGRGYGDGAIPRSWVWNHIESDGAKRPRFNGLVAAALDVLASRETDQSGSSVATLGTHTPASPPTPTPVNPIQERGLSLIEISILQYLLEVHATSSDRRKTSDEIAKAAVAHESGGSVRKNMSALIKDGHVQSTGGRAGGYWLTPGGVERAVRLKPD